MSSTPKPFALSPLYTCDINEPVQLYAGEGVLIADGRSRRAECVLQYAWSPVEGPEVIFPTSVLDDDNIFLEIPSIGLSARIAKRRHNYGTHGNSFTGLLTGDIQTGSGQSLARVIFHVANFPFVLGDPIVQGTRHINGRIHLENSPWVIDIDPVPDPTTPGTPDLPSRIAEARGQAITHVGALWRADGLTFSAADADAVLNDIGRTLSFARAAFSTPILRIGHDAAENVVWCCWSSYRTDRWDTRDNWFSWMNPQPILQSVFAGWRRLSAINDEVISAASHLYIDSHSAHLAVETRLIIAQAALEGLADGWPYPPAIGSATPPSSRSAAGRIIQIAVSLGLPITVPTVLTSLAALQHPTPTATALEKITWIRNSVAHLGNFPRLASHSWRVKYEASTLAAWHLELAILRLLDADGVYSNRLTESMMVERLPWHP